MIATDWVKLNIKPTNTKITNIPIKFGLSPSQIISTVINIYCPRPRNTLSSLTNIEWLKLIKEKICFYC